jgi:hypothetical protein
MQVLVIVGILIQIRVKRNNVLGKSVNVINRDFIQFSKESKYKYFYEPRANIWDIVRPAWKGNILPMYTTNSDALHETLEYDIVKPSDTFRIVALGDSFTFGQNVSTKDNWTEIMENRLNGDYVCEGTKKYEVINLGVTGYDTAYEVERYRLRGQKYNPDLIVWFVTDLQRITESYMEIYNNLSQSNKDKMENDYFHSIWENTRKMVVNKYTEKGILDYQVSKFKEFRSKYYPTDKPILIVSTLDEVNKFGKENMYYSGTGAFGSKEYLLPDGHFNELGHQVFTEDVIKALSTHSLLPCDR